MMPATPGPDLLARVLHRLPGGHALLFGGAELPGRRRSDPLL
ncbi:MULTISPECIES: hypothetical protein [unclassified Streptomyces]|nr:MULTISPECIES: hypothetical protein [unclassified Streptomyces]